MNETPGSYETAREPEHRLSTERVLEITLREMQAIGQAWRLDWSDFDGRVLRNQLNDLSDWAEKAARDDTRSEYIAGSEFLSEVRQG